MESPYERYHGYQAERSAKDARTSSTKSSELSSASSVEVGIIVNELTEAGSVTLPFVEVGDKAGGLAVVSNCAITSPPWSSIPLNRGFGDLAGSAFEFSGGLGINSTLMLTTEMIWVKSYLQRTAVHAQGQTLEVRKTPKLICASVRPGCQSYGGCAQKFSSWTLMPRLFQGRQGPTCGAIFVAG